MNYSALVIEHFEHPRNVGVIDGHAVHVGRASLGTRGFSDVMQIHVRCDDDGIKVP